MAINGYPTVLARISRQELEALFRGYGYAPIIVEGDVPEVMHQAMAAAFDQAFAHRENPGTTRAGGSSARPFWPMIVLRSPKGWTGPKTVDGLKTEGSWRSHQVPISDMSKSGHLHLLEEWMASYRPAELFDQAGRFRAEIAALAPSANRRMSANPHANGGALKRPLRLPDFKLYAVPVVTPGQGMLKRHELWVNFCAM